MSNVEVEFGEIRKYFVTWITKVKLDNALTYFDINRISEGTSQQLLELVFGYDLKDLNREKKNFPGIDLGSRNNGMAFQVTSRTDATKIVETLRIFVASGYKKDFPKGIRFFIINDRKSIRIKAHLVEEYKSIFDHKKDIYFPADLIEEIESLYYSNYQRFAEIKEFLKDEFGAPDPSVTIVKSVTSAEKVVFYKRLFAAHYKPIVNRFVDFSCKAGEEEIRTDNLPERLFVDNGGLITGPSGCGKSILARQLAVTFLDRGIPILLEAKYYDSNLDALFEKEAKAFGFDSGNDIIITCKESNLQILVIIDGLNECSSRSKAKLLLELEHVLNTHGVLVLVTTQVIDDEINSLNLKHISVTYPDHTTKKAIAASHGEKKNNVRLEPILHVVSSSLEAKMIGEIGAFEIDNVSRFTLFEIFIKHKLGDFNADASRLLSYIARFLSDNISFNLSERQIEDLLLSVGLTVEVYKKCLLVKLLESKVGKVSFIHEMFFNFFVADSVVRFAANADEIINKINAPKNHDKKLLIIGSISDSVLLSQALYSLTDVDLLVALHAGEGGSYCRLWVERQLKDILIKIKDEIHTLDFGIIDNDIHQIQFKSDNVRKWSHQELALVHALPYVMIKDRYLSEVFELVGQMDDRCSLAIQVLWPAAKEKSINIRSEVFSTTYIGFSIKQAAITRIFSSLQSGFVTFNNPSSISESSITHLLKNNTLKHGQLYLLLILLRYTDTLHLLYPYIQNSLNNWRIVPYHLINEILHQIGHCYAIEEQRNQLIDALHAMHSQTQNIFLSTSIFEALGDLGALNEDSEAHESTVIAEIADILKNPDNSQSWDHAATIYYAQFDHPYDTAYYTVIQQLPETVKIPFFRLALRGYYSSLFTMALIIDTWKYLQADIAPYLVRWTETPFIEPTFPQASLQIFLSAHLVLAKSNYPLITRYTSEVDPIKKSLFAVAEVYYWLNKPDNGSNLNKKLATPGSHVVFDSCNRHGIESIWQLRHALLQSSLYKIFQPGDIIMIETAFSDQVVNMCRIALGKLEWQKDIFDYPRDNDINLHAIWLLKDHGSIIDLDILRPLSDHPIYGAAAVDAIKKLS